MIPVVAFLAVLFVCEACNDAPTTSTGNFYLGTEKVTRDQAVQLCEARSMELVSIGNCDKNEAIFQLLKEKEISYAVWTSGHKSSDGKTWAWLNGEEIKYFKWGPGEPNEARGNESCIEVFKKNSEVLWNDQPCGDKRSFICAPKKITENFYLDTEKVSRDQAEGLCKQRSMELVSIQSPEKNEAIFHLLNANGIGSAIWTSGQKNSDGRSWSWLNGEQIIYFNWGPGEPNEARGDESCMEISKTNSNVLWNDQPCQDKRGFICEKKCERKAELLSVTIDNKVCSKSIDAPNTPKKKFYLSTQKATRDQALQNCSDMFMQLARLNGEDESADLFKLMRAKGTSTPYWTSGYRKPQGPWKWLNDEPIRYFNWAEGEPNYQGNDNICIEVVTNEKAVLWNDQYCSSERFFICEKLNPIVKITVKGNLAITHGLVTSNKDACTVVVNTQ